MNVLVDTSVWSLALRRKRRKLSSTQSSAVFAFGELVAEGRVRIIGAIRQEVLSGIRDGRQFASLRDHLRNFDDEPLDAHDYELAAEFCNNCRRRGVASQATDMLLCAVASGRGIPIFTHDADFTRYAATLPIRLYDAGDAAIN